MKNKIISVVVLTIIVGAIAFTLYKNKQEFNEQANIKQTEFAIPVKVAAVEQKALSEALIATGEFQGWDEVTLVAESQGSIEYLSFNEGDKVEKGQIIAKIDAISLNSQLTSLKSSFAKAERDVARFERLEKSGAISKVQLEESRLQLENVKSSIAQIEQQLDFTIVKSPISGVVNEIMVEESGFVMPGNQIAQVVQVDKLKIIVRASEDDLSKIREGQNVKVKTNVYPLKEFGGTVTNISVKADASRKFKVTIRVDNTSEAEQLRAGMFAEVYFDKVASQNNVALFIPRSALVGSMLDASVYVVEDELAMLRSIKTGSKVDGQVVVLSGLASGQQIVTSGQINLKDNTKVKITK